MSQPQEKPAKKVAALFDLRLIIGALFTLYGIVLIITGLTDGSEELHKASGIRINLWAGIGMLVTGLLFLLWMKLTGDGHDRPEHAATGNDAGETKAAAGEGSPAA
jgi:H+/Cl- antiporter ClcA